MKTEFEVLGLSHVQGTGNDGKPYDYYKAHIAYPSQWVEGVAVAVVSIPTVEVHSRCIMVGSRMEGLILNVQGRTRLYFV